MFYKIGHSLHSDPSPNGECSLAYFKFDDRSRSHVVQKNLFTICLRARVRVHRAVKMIVIFTVLSTGEMRPCLPLAVNKE